MSELRQYKLKILIEFYPLLNTQKIVTLERQKGDDTNQ